ncbi:MAG: hypothetical protein HY735_34235 [Verrucomicrobia bacterium]|nr:hypothetical protein [Verrucomicrobiota bacterium]
MDSKLTPEWDYLVGDATAAYGDRLQRYRRHVAFVKGGMAGPVIVLFDDLVANEPSRFQFMLHALKPFETDDPRDELSVEQPRAGVEVKFLSPSPISFRQWDGYEPKPDRDFPNQWHVEASTNEKRKEIGLLTVLMPYHSGQRPDWRAERLESETAMGVRVTRGDKASLIAFRKAHASRPVSLAGQSIEGNIAVR